MTELEARTASAAQELETRGFFVFKDFFPLDEVEAARREILEWVAKDLAERETLGVQEALHKGVSGTTILTRPTHLVLDAYAKSATLDRMVERILTDPYSSSVLNKLVGPHIKLRGYNVQKLTGQADPRPAIGHAPNPHEWHRDSLGEIGIALFLEDVPGFGYGATAVVPGSHQFPYCPRWNALLGPPYVMPGGKTGHQGFLTHNLFNKKLAHDVVNPIATGAYGRKGDFYFFINDLWHGREPNTEGAEGIKFMIGAFASDDPFPDQVDVPDQAILDQLPPALRKAAAQERPAEMPPTDDTIIKRLRAKRAAERPPLIFKLAQAERRMADAVSRWVS